MTEQQKSNEQKLVTAQQVLDFLIAEPGFFKDYPEVLEKAKQDAAGEGVASLTLRQLSSLREQNRSLQLQLNNLVEIARENDSLFVRIQDLTTALIEANSVEDVFATLDDTLRECFGADSFAVRLIADKEQADFPISGVLWQQDSLELAHFKKVMESQKIKCGHPTHAQAVALFAGTAGEILSSAFIPFKLGNNKGLLAIGSKAEKRFHPSMGTMFLSHLGELVGKRLHSLQSLESAK